MVLENWMVEIPSIPQVGPEPAWCKKRHHLPGQTRLRTNGVLYPELLALIQDYEGEG